MTYAAITIVGLGPGSMSDLTLEAHKVLNQAVVAGQAIYFRTIIHPTVEALKQATPDLRIESFDRLYDESDDWAQRGASLVPSPIMATSFPPACSLRM